MERAAEESSGWDIGQRPTVRMPYLEYPTYVPDNTVSLRNDDQMRLFAPHESVKSLEHQRVETRGQTGWASDKREIYKPLGKPQDLPATGPELRRRKTAEYHKPKVVVPDKIQKGEEEEEENLAIRLEAGVPTQGAVQQFHYQYYQFDLPERLNLVFALRASQGDPDLFVSNEVMCPKQEPSEHTWRGAATGDDEINITIDDPRYTVGTYYIGVYTVSEYSEFEIVAILQEPPTRIVMEGDARRMGNGYSHLTKMVVSSEQRRMHSLFGLKGRAERPQPKDPNQMFHQLPTHLQTALSPRSKPPDAGSFGGGGGKKDDASGKKDEPGSARRGSTGGGPAAAAPSAAPPPSKQPVSFLISPYLTNACFGQGLNPLRGAQISQLAAMAPQEQYAGAPGEAAAALARLGSPSTASPRNPWVPNAETETCKQADVEEMVARAPTELTTQVMQVRHHALKNDMEAQMRRIAEGLEAERALIAHFKAAAFEKEMAEQNKLVEEGKALPLSTNAVDTMRMVRAAADEMRAATLKKLAEVAEAEANRATQKADEKAKRRSVLQRATWLKLGAVHAFGKGNKGDGGEGGPMGGRRMSVRRNSMARRASQAGMDANAQAAAAAAAHHNMRASKESVGGGRGSKEEMVGGGGGGAMPTFAQQRERRSSMARKQSVKPAVGPPASIDIDGGLPNIFQNRHGSVASMLANFKADHHGGGGGGDEGGAPAAGDQLSQLLPISLPRLQPGLSSKGKRVSVAAMAPSPNFELHSAPSAFPPDAAPPSASEGSSRAAAPSPGSQATTATSAAPPPQHRPAPVPPPGPKPSKLSIKSSKAPVKRVDGAKRREYGGGGTFKVSLDSTLFGVAPATMA